MVDWNKIIFKQLTIKGIYGREMFETWHKMIAMLESGLDVRKVITHRLPAEKFLEGFEIMRRGESGKIVLDWTVRLAVQSRRLLERADFEFVWV